MIEIKELKFSFEGRELISNLSLVIDKGEKRVITGASGSGKTSLLSILAGFIPFEKGEIWIDGEKITTGSRELYASKIAWLPQEFYLPYESVQELVDALFSLRMNRKRRPSDEEIMVGFERVNLSKDYLNRSFKQLSGGERQRVLLVLTLLQKKPIIILDEPTSALDPQSVDKVIAWIEEMQETTFVMVSHDSKFINSFTHILTLPQ